MKTPLRWFAYFCAFRLFHPPSQDHYIDQNAMRHLIRGSRQLRAMSLWHWRLIKASRGLLSPDFLSALGFVEASQGRLLFPGSLSALGAIKEICYWLVCYAVTLLLPSAELRQRTREMLFGVLFACLSRTLAHPSSRKLPWEIHIPWQACRPFGRLSSICCFRIP